MSLKDITEITCPHCGQVFGINEAIKHQIDDELARVKSKELERLEKELNEEHEKKTQAAVENALKEAKDKETVEIERLKSKAESSRKSEAELREQIKTLLEELSNERKARDNAEIDARKKLLEKEKEIKEEAKNRAFDDFNTKIREQEETIRRLREQLTEAKQVAEQGSQQLQGEILELDIEQNLNNSFPLDDVREVKKGERGSDIRQTVNEQQYQNCGLILWECKNAKTFQKPWVDKLREELIKEKAQAGVIVFNSPDINTEDFEKLSDNIWLVKPRYAIMLATLLRQIIIKVFITNRNNQGKDAKIEMMYNYLTGGEFANRVKYIIQSYNELKEQLDNEKRQTQKRWAAQEKILQKTVDSLYGMGGDLQGIIGKEVIALPVDDE